MRFVFMTVVPAVRWRSIRLVLFAASLPIAGVARSAAAQDVPNREAALEVRKRFVEDLDTLQSKFVALANAFPADKYAWRPAPGVRSVGEVFMHVASEYYVYAPMSYGATRSSVIDRGQDALKSFEAKSTKEDVLKHLKEGFAYTKQQIDGLDPTAITGTKKLFGGDRTIIQTSFFMTDDLHEHLGQLIGYARMNGVVPPWSK
jgi:DinB family protein